ncbi:MAG: hypothetical protein ABJB74_07575 [Gemmatimonas sp.]
MSKRRTFITQLGVAAAALAFDADEMSAQSGNSTSEWDKSWLDRLAKAKFRVVFNATVIDDGGVLDYANTFYDHFHEVHGTDDPQTRPVIVFRRNGTPMAFNDAIWDRYAIGEDAKVNDPVTNAPAKRNVFWKAEAGASSQNVSRKLESLHARGLISLVCNVAATNIARRLADRAQIDPAAAIKDVTSNLVPGAILVPSGIYALIRAQNAGCAFMLGT